MQFLQNHCNGPSEYDRLEDTLHYVVPDTNVFLHCKSLGELRFPSLQISEEITFVIPHTVINELDRLKFDSSDDRIRKRAKAAIKLIQEYTERVRRDGIRLEIASSIAGFDYEAKNLDPNVNDDRILAEVLGFLATNKNVGLSILSNDYGMVIKARSQGITAITPTESDMLVEVEDPRDRELRKLRDEIVSLRHARPRCRLEAAKPSITGAPFQFKVVTPKLSNSHLETSLKKFVGEKPIFDDYYPFSQILKYDARAFDEDWDKFIKKARAYLIQMWRLKNRVFPLSFVLYTENDVPAEDVQVQLTFNDTLPAQFLASAPEELETPLAPKPRMSGVGGVSSFGITFPNYSSIMMPAVDLSKIDRATIQHRNEARFNRRLLRPRQPSPLDELMIQFEDSASPQNFSVEYAITARNVVGVDTGTIGVTFA